MRKWLRRKLSKQTRHKFIELFVKHRYWYEQGHVVTAGFKIVTLMEILGVVAFCKYMFGDLPIGVFVFCGLVWFPVRTLVYWLIGKFWHDNGGYKIQTDWNMGKVPVGRVEVVNLEELAALIVERLAKKLSIKSHKQGDV
uniref:Uncharacterized protein n=1 Tax=viral metagenome TaxID=1070528 RepID=A0A6M3LGL1_9ZZZZ